MQAANYRFFLVSGRRHEGAKTVPIEPSEAVGTGFCQLPSRPLGAAAKTTRLSEVGHEARSRVQPSNELSSENRPTDQFGACVDHQH